MEGGIQERDFAYTVTNYTPVLMHNPQGMGRSGGAKVKRIPSELEEAQQGLYIDDKGRLFLKFIAFRNCMLGGSRGLKIGKESAYGFLAGTILNVELDEPCVLLCTKDDLPMTKQKFDAQHHLKDDYEIDVRRVVVQKAGVMRARPKLRHWWSVVKLTADISQVTEAPDYDALVMRCLNRGGQFKGVGDYRPQNSGPFGRFTARVATAEDLKKYAAATANGGAGKKPK